MGRVNLTSLDSILPLDASLIPASSIQKRACDDPRPLMPSWGTGCCRKCRLTFWQFRVCGLRAGVKQIATALPPCHLRLPSSTNYSHCLLRRGSVVAQRCLRLRTLSLSSAPTRPSFVLLTHATVQIDQAVYIFPCFAHEILLENAAGRCIEHNSAREAIITRATTRRNDLFIHTHGSALP